MYNKERKLNSTSEKTAGNEKIVEGIVLAELMNYLEETKSSSDVKPVFKLAFLSQMYNEKLEQHGINASGRIHTTRLKERLLAHMPEIEAYKSGRDVLIGYRDDIGEAMRQVCIKNSDDEGIILVQAANIVRREIMENNMEQKISEMFSSGAQEQPIRISVLALVKMILYGTKTNEVPTTQAALTISQLLQFNCQKSQTNSTKLYHKRDNEKSIPVYIGLAFHAAT